VSPDGAFTAGDHSQPLSSLGNSVLRYALRVEEDQPDIDQGQGRGVGAYPPILRIRRRLLSGRSLRVLARLPTCLRAPKTV